MQFDGLTVSAQGKIIVDNFSLVIKPGEVHCLFGPNGSGKSSLSLAVVGHPDYQIKQGKLLIDGENWLEYSPEKRARKGLFLQFQQPVEVPGVRVHQFLRQAYLSREWPEAHKRLSAFEFFQYLEKLASFVDLKLAFLQRGLNEGFSGGEKKRLEVLQMLVLAPRFAILDELDSGLDFDALQILTQQIKTLQQQHQTGILLITHNAKILDYLQPDFVHVMIKGRITQTAGVELIKKLEKTGYQA